MMKPSAVVLLALTLLGCAGSRLEETQRRGDRIVAALEAYRSAHGEYPDALLGLVPAHLADLTPPTWGLRSWRYSGGRAGFTLCVDESARTGDGNSHWLKYMGPELEWQLGD